MSTLRRSSCANCGESITQAATGRPRLYCSAPCREARRARNTGVRSTTQGRFWQRVTQDGDCWTYVGKLNPQGYGRFYVAGRGEVQAHRFAYEDMVSPIPEGLVLDHLCRNRACVNPYHLEPVTDRVNVARGAAPSAIARRTGRCGRGHEMTADNTYHRPDGKGRQCRECNRLRQARGAA